jgi:hypothetical protein
VQVHRPTVAVPLSRYSIAAAPLGDLHRVESRRLCGSGRRDEQVDAAAVVAADVLADAAHEHVVLPAGLQRHGEVVAWLRVVHDLHARRLAARISRTSMRGDRALELEVDRLAVRPRHRHAHAGGRHHDLRVAEDLPRLVHHLVLFLVVAVLGDLRVVAEEVVDDLVRELLASIGSPAA